MSKNYFIEANQSYPPDYFIGWKGRILTSASISNPYALSRYDFKILGTNYNVHTKEINGKQKVTSIWDKTNEKSIEKLEVLAEKCQQ